jgi:hypothetical protein
VAGNDRHLPIAGRSHGRPAEPSSSTTRSSASLAEAFDIDLIYGRNIAGENANWLTLGLNLRF